MKKIIKKLTPVGFLKVIFSTGLMADEKLYFFLLRQDN